MDKLLSKHNLTAKDCDEIVSDIHIGVISRDYCMKWSDLYPYLNLKEIDVYNVKRDYHDEQEKKGAFFSLWRQREGSHATYAKLIQALLKLECKKDAESICKLLQLSKGPTGMNCNAEIVSRHLCYSTLM